MENEKARKLVALVIFGVLSYLIPQFLLPTLEIDFVHPAIITYLVLAIYAFFAWVWRKQGFSQALVVAGIAGGGAYVLGLQSQSLGYHPAFGWGLGGLIALVALWPFKGKKENQEAKSGRQAEVILGDAQHEVNTPSGRWGVSLSELYRELERQFGQKAVKDMAEALHAQNDRFQMFLEVMREAEKPPLEAARIAAEAANIRLPDLEEVSPGDESEVDIDPGFGGDIRFL